jgi:hypothetical protein
MKQITALSLIFLSASLLPTLSAHAEQAIMFKPPQLGAPSTPTVGGGTRGISGLKKPVATIQLLASKKTGLSSSATPTLYWYMPKVSANNVKLTVRQDENTALLEKNIGAVKTAGLQTIHLADYGMSLTAGQDYTWSITVEGDPEQGAADLFASAVIRYVVPVTPLKDVAQMAAEGYWYDTVAQLVDTKSPQLNPFLQREGIKISTKH